MKPSDLESIAEALAELVLGGSMERDKTVDGLGALVDAIVRLDARVAEIETRGVQYRGVWQAAMEYRRGDLVTLGGSVYHANHATRAKPNGPASGWTLAAKCGADGKDAEHRRPTGAASNRGEWAWRR